MFMSVRCVGYFSSVRTEVTLCSSSSSSSSTLRLRIGRSSFDFVFEEELVAAIALGLAFGAAGILFPLAGSLADEDDWEALTACLGGTMILFLVEITLPVVLPFRFLALDSFESTDADSEAES